MFKMFHFAAIVKHMALRSASICSPFDSYLSILDEFIFVISTITKQHELSIILSTIYFWLKKKIVCESNSIIWPEWNGSIRYISLWNIMAFITARSTANRTANPLAQMNVFFLFHNSDNNSITFDFTWVEYVIFALFLHTFVL